LFSPSVVEPGAYAKMAKWEYKPGSAGWGDHEAMLNAIETAVSSRQYLLGDMFSIADVVFGGTLRYMTRFNMLTPSPAVTAYISRLDARPALQRADARNNEIAKAHGLNT
jgi:glutathione S-transferase